MEANIKIKPEYFEAVIVGALEGGSNYWYILNGIGKVSDSTKGEPASMRIAKELWSNPEYRLDVYDNEDPTELLGTVTQKSMVNAFNARPEELAAIIKGNDDAETADLLFQQAVMGEVIFG